MLHVHAADENLEEELYVNQDFNHRFTSSICIHLCLFAK